MFKKSCSVFFLIFLFLLFVSVTQVHAIDNPLIRPNNKIGIHILFPSELYDAAKLVNANGGDWGYLTVPIHANDRDLEKWQVFMREAKKQHLIPILRLATDADQTNTTVWRRPKLADVIDFATFLDQLDWPIKNRYVIVFNEVNRGDEWGGAANPAEYADILSFAVTVFKSKNPDYFIISSGLDNAAPNQGATYMNEYIFMQKMHDAVPGIFNQVDGLASHSYPNPGFSQPPSLQSNTGVGSFKFERDLAKSLSGKDLPTFITETGWSADTVSEEKRIQYYQEAFATIWNDPSIVAITPFLFDARSGPFQKFSFLTETGLVTKQYEMLRDLPKIKGVPLMPVKVLAAETSKTQPDKKVSKPETGFSFAKMVQGFLAKLKGV